MERDVQKVSYFADLLFHTVRTLTGGSMCSLGHQIKPSICRIIIIIRCQIWNRHWRPCLSKHLCHQTTSKNVNPYFVHLLPSYKDYQEMLFVVCPYRVCLLLYQLKIRIPSLYDYTHVLKIPFASSQLFSTVIFEHSPLSIHLHWFSFLSMRFLTFV